jgi:primosomal protein N' (replication factor Y)
MLYKVAILGLRIPPLTYFSPDEMRLGSLVAVELRKEKWLGIVWEKETMPPERKVKTISRILFPEFFPVKLLQFYNFVSKYYFVYPGEVLTLAFPGIKRMRRTIENLLGENRSAQPAKTLWSTPSAPNFAVILLTGKNEEEKMRLITQKVAKGEGCILYLFPEMISAERVFARLKEKIEGIVFYHSKRKRSELVRLWSGIKKGEYRVVIGTKQAVFLPIPALREILVEDEASSLYKEEKRHFHYQARDCALMRGRFEKIPVTLFSYTPSLESFYFCLRGRYKFYGGFRKKDVKIIIADFGEENRVLTNPLRKFLARYREGEVFYLLNQRQGFSRYIICADCGFIPRCGECGFPFFYHQKELLFSCHICQKKERVFDECPNCQGINFLFKGIGIERVERELKMSFPRLAKIVDEKKGIFLGSAFGLNRFPDDGIDLGAIISFEQLLSFPDFRTEERAWQIIQKFIGKIKKGGFLIIQTKTPRHPILSNLFNPPHFFRRLLKEREGLAFPPFFSVVTLRIYGGEELVTKKYEELRKKIAPYREEVKIFPPIKSSQRKRGRHLSTIVLKLKGGLRLYQILKKEELFGNGEEIEVDINPNTILTPTIK